MNNGYDPNGNNYNDGFMGGYDPNNSGYPPYQANGYQNNNADQGYGSYNGYNSQQNGYNGYNSQQNGYNGYNGQQNGYNSYNDAGSYGQTASGYAPVGTQVNTGVITLAEYSKRIFLWMGVGLAVTFAVALGLMLYLTSGSEIDLYDKFSNMLPIFYGGIVVEFVLAFVLGLFVKKLPHTASLILFIVYSVVSGVTFTPVLVVYDAGSAIFAFAATAVLFFGFAIYGIVTKRDLTKLGPILLIGLIVLIIFSVIGILFHMSWLSIGISVLGIAIFIGLAAYDAQKIKTTYNTYANDEEMLKKTTVNLALQLYLDFVNIFIYILRLLGKARR